MVMAHQASQTASMRLASGMRFPSSRRDSRGRRAVSGGGARSAQPLRGRGWRPPAAPPTQGGGAPAATRARAGHRAGRGCSPGGGACRRRAATPPAPPRAGRWGPARAFARPLRPAARPRARARRPLRLGGQAPRRRRASRPGLGVGGSPLLLRKRRVHQPGQLVQQLELDRRRLALPAGHQHSRARAVLGHWDSRQPPLAPWAHTELHQTGFAPGRDHHRAPAAQRERDTPLAGGHPPAEQVGARAGLGDDGRPGTPIQLAHHRQHPLGPQNVARIAGQPVQSGTRTAQPGIAAAVDAPR